MAFGGDDNKMEIEVRLDAEQATRGLEKLQDKLQETSSTVQKSDTGFSKLQKNLIALNQGADLARRAFTIMSGAARTFDRAMTATMQSENITRGFQHFARTIGQDAIPKLNELKAATHGFIQETQLMQIATKAMVAGIDDGSGAFDRAVGNITKLARATGMDAVQAVNMFNQAMATGRTTTLAQMGIVVNAAKAHEEYARQIGKTAQELTQAEKKQAVLNAAFADAEQKAKGLSGEARTMAEVHFILKNELANVADNTLQLISKNPTLVAQYKDLTSGVGDFARGVQVLSANLLILNERAARSGGLYDKMRQGLESAPFVGGLFKANRLMGDYDVNLLGALRDKLQANAKALEDVDSAADGAAGSIEGLSEEAEEFAVSASRVSEQAKKMADAMEALLTQIRAPLQEDAIDVFTEQIITLNLEWQKHQDVMVYVAALEALASTVKGDAQGMANFTEATRRASAEMKEYRRQSEGINIQYDRITLAEKQQSIDAASGSFSAYLNLAGMPSVASQFFGKQLGQMFPQVGEWMAGSLGSMMLPIIGMVIQGVDAGLSKMRDLERTNPAAIGQERFDAFYGGGLEGIFGKELGGLLAKLPKEPLGVIFEKVLVGLGLFGTGNRDTAGRQSLGGWFREDALREKDLQLIIRDQLANVTSITTNWPEIYNATPAPGFEGVGRGFAELMKEMQVPAEQFVAILSENMGGSLNNMQLMLQTIGITVQELTAALDELYLSGKMNAKDFLSAQRDVQEVYKQGIPGAVGATDQAFENLVAGGLANGRIAMDAFGDLAAEAIEKGISSLEGLREDLIALGMPIDQVDKLFAAFANNGIDSLEKLKDIGITGTAQLVSDLQDMGFAFDKPIEGARELYEIMNDIYSKKDIDINIKLNMSAQDKALLQMTRDAQNGATGGSSGGEEGRVGAMSTMSYMFGRHLRPNVYRRLDALRERESGELQRSYMAQIGSSAMGLFQQAAGMSGGGSLEMYKQAVDITKELDKAQQIYNFRLENGGRITQKLLDRLMAAEKAAQDFGQQFNEMINPQGATAKFVEEFFGGKINAVDAAAGIGGIAGRTGGGLAGFADIGGALQQLIAGGVGTGGFAGLKNLFVEAQEGGISLGQLGENLMQQGFDPAFIGRIMEELGKKGAHTIEAALRLADEEIIDLLAKINGQEVTVTVNAEMGAGWEGIVVDDDAGSPGMGSDRRRKRRRRKSRIEARL
jgi:hypothetical protein